MPDRPINIPINPYIKVPLGLSTVSVPHRATFWKLIGRVALREKRKDIEAGRDRWGHPFVPVIRRWGDPTPLLPHGKASRTYSLLTFNSSARGATLYWKAGAGRESWPKILSYHAYKRGTRRLPVRNAFHLSPASAEVVMAESEMWKAGYEAGLVASGQKEKATAEKKKIGGAAKEAAKRPAKRQQEAVVAEATRKTKQEETARKPIERRKTEETKKAEAEQKAKAEVERRIKEANRAIEEKAKEKLAESLSLNATQKRADDYLAQAKQWREDAKKYFATTKDAKGSPEYRRQLARVKRAEVFEDFAREPRIEWSPAETKEEAIEWGKRHNIKISPGHESRISLDDINFINGEFSKLPKSAIDMVKKRGNGIDLVGGKGITEHPSFAHLKGVAPRGYREAGSNLTWDDVPGVGGQSGAVLAASRVSSYSGSSSLLLHEYGHAYDFSAKAEDRQGARPSLKAEWETVHKAHVWETYLERPEESYAESFAKYFVNPVERSSLPQDVRDYFNRNFQ